MQLRGSRITIVWRELETLNSDLTLETALFMTHNSKSRYDPRTKIVDGVGSAHNRATYVPYVRKQVHFGAKHLTLPSLYTARTHLFAIHNWLLHELQGGLLKFLQVLLIWRVARFHTTFAPFQPQIAHWGRCQPKERRTLLWTLF